MTMARYVSLIFDCCFIEFTISLEDGQLLIEAHVTVSLNVWLKGNKHYFKEYLTVFQSNVYTYFLLNLNVIHKRLYSFQL